MFTQYRDFALISKSVKKYRVTDVEQFAFQFRLLAKDVWRFAHQIRGLQGRLSIAVE